MKFTFDTNYFEKPLWNDTERAEALDKMHAMANFTNLKFIAGEVNKCAEEDEKRDGENRKISAYEVDTILCDEDQAIDEFYLLGNEDLIIGRYGYELVTKEVAEANEEEWLRDVAYTDEDRASYKLGEVMSLYLKLPELSPKGVQYYLRLL